MKLLSLMGLAFLLGLAVSSTNVHAAPFDHTWVASNGDDLNDCSRENPCRNLTFAHNNTNPNGTVHCVDSVAHVGVTITKSITIDCSGTNGTNAVSGSPGSIGRLDIQTSASDTVILRGMRLNFQGGTGLAFSINIATAGNVIIEDVHVTNSGAAGIIMRPNGAARLTIVNSLITRNGSGVTGAGVRVVPQPGGTAQVSIKNSTISGNVFGVAFDGSNSTGGINATIVDSLMSGNSQDGIVATSTAAGAPVGVTVVNSQSLNNGYGVRSIGSNVTVRAEGSKIIGNGTGLSGGGALLSGGGNTVQANATNGGFTGSYALQ